jgi:hypothetical protein
LRDEDANGANPYFEPTPRVVAVNPRKRGCSARRLATPLRVTAPHARSTGLVRIGAALCTGQAIDIR